MEKKTISREIKFRAWTGKEMLIDVIPVNDEAVITDMQGFPSEATVLYRHDIKSIMQFTGVTNEHQQEIYDGDKILYNGIDEKRHNEGGHIYGVYWHNTHHGWLAYCIENEQYLEAEFFGVCKVVGNIHQN